MATAASDIYPVGDKDDLERFIEKNQTEDWPDLTAVKRAFAIEYVMNGYNHRDAAETLNVPKDRGIRLLRDPLVAAYVKTLQDDQRTNGLITRDFINAQYMTLYEMATGQKAHPFVAGGEILNEARVDMPSAISILKEMSKSTDYEKAPSTVKGGVSIHLNLGSLLGNDQVEVSIEAPVDAIDGEFNECD